MRHVLEFVAFVLASLEFISPRLLNPNIIKILLFDPHWKVAMDSEFSTLVWNNTWHLVYG
jgi:hypothetical protein